MASIAGYAVTSFNGRMSYPYTPKGVIPGDPGVEGDGVIQGAKKAALSLIRTGTSFDGTMEQARALAQTFRDLLDESAGIIVQDQFGVVWSEVIVMSCTAEPSYTAIDGRVRVDCAWEFKVPATGPLTD